MAYVLSTNSKTGLSQSLRREHAWLGIVAKVIFCLVLPLAGPSSHTAAYLLLAAWSLGGPRRSVEALTLVWLITYLNPGVYSLSDRIDLLRWVVVCFAFATVTSISFYRGFRVPRAWFWVAVFCFTAAGLAFYSSYSLNISLLKLVSFFMGTTSILFGFHLTRFEGIYWRQWFLAFFAVIVVLSFPLIGHELGYVRNERGFQGLLNHPQAYAAFMAPFFSWLIAMLTVREMKGWLPWTIALTAGVSLYASQARFGAVAVGGGLAFAVAGRFWRATWNLGAIVRWVPRLIIILFLIVPIAILFGNRIVKSGQNFVMKGQSERSVDEAFYLSRGFLIERSLRNFQENRLTGIGFGVPSDPGMLAVQKEPLAGVPIGASVEKGLIISAVMEEIGLIGSLFFLLMLGSLFKPILGRHAGLPSAALAFSAIWVNVGESSFLALGGMGLLVWLMIGCARVTAGRRP